MGIDEAMQLGVMEAVHQALGGVLVASDCMVGVSAGHFTKAMTTVIGSIWR